MDLTAFGNKPFNYLLTVIVLDFVFQKSAYDACWSPFVETLLASCNEDALYIWDISRNSYVNYVLYSYVMLINNFTIVTWAIVVVLPVDGNFIPIVTRMDTDRELFEQICISLISECLETATDWHYFLFTVVAFSTLTLLAGCQWRVSDV